MRGHDPFDVFVRTFRGMGVPSTVPVGLRLLYALHASVASAVGFISQSTAGGGSNFHSLGSFDFADATFRSERGELDTTDRQMDRDRSRTFQASLLGKTTQSGTDSTSLSMIKQT